MSGFKSKNNFRNSFTLIELLVVLALVAILSVVVVMTLNPAELIKQARDSNRLSDLSTINTALNLFSADVTSGFMGTSTVVYVSIPDTSPTCANLGLPALPTSTIVYTYGCTTAANLRNTNGTGWIPVNFQRISSNSPISQLPVDPQNTTSTKYYTYVAGGSWQLTSKLESAKYQATAYSSGGADPSMYTIGNNLSLAPFVGGLVSWWKFDETSGAAATDSSGWNNNGTASGTTIVPGKIGNARSFNGTTDLVNINNPVLGASQFTVCVWAYKSTASQYQSLISDYDSTGYRDNFLLGYEVQTTLYFFVGNQNLVRNDNVSVGGFTASVWHNVCGVLDGVNGRLSIYIDGVGNTKASTLVPYIGNVQSVYSFIGRYNVPFYFNGKIDDVRFYKRALSAAEVLALYNAGR